MPSSRANIGYRSRLHSLIAKGSVPSRRAWQDSILTYLTQNCSVSNSLLKKEKKLYFPSPLPVNVVPKNSLLNELQRHEHGDTPLTLAVRHNCTNDVIAALCHLFPDGSKVADTSGALPLHIAAGHPSVVSSKKKKSAEAEISKTIGILVEANPSALVSRDGHGKTPLHCLLDHHADTRNLATVQLLSRIVDEKVWKFEVEAKAEEENEKVLMPIPSIIRKKLPKEVNSKVNFFTPASALVIPDSLVGAIPLHYAVKNGISKDIVAFLIKAYPSSVCHIDCNAHTPLHWIFGAHKDNKKVPAHHVYRSASVISMLLQRDLTQTYNVATMKDMNENGEPHRTPLHYAVGLLAKNIIDPIPSKGEISSSCITLKSLQALIDADSKALITRDSLGQTPLHVLFRTVFEMHEADYKKALQIAKTGEKCALLKEPKAFSPPKVLLSLLIEGTPQESINPATIQDIRGMLPLHCAVLAVSSPTVLGALIDHNPRSLTHLSSTSSSEFISKYYDLLPSEDAFYVNSFEGSRTPLHMAYANPFFINSYTDAMIQKLLFYDSAVSNTRKSDNDSRIKIDASIALKMQDSHGDTPLHLAAKNNANIERLSNLLQRDHLASMTLNEDGDLPLHLLLDEHFLFVNIELALAHSGSLGASNSLEKLNNTEFRDKVRDLAKKQTVAIRMAKFQLSGAIFAPSNGWSTNEEESNEKNQIELMKKMNLLGMPLVNNEGCLRAACSKHGLLPIHILVAFHAVPYQVISSMIRKAPNSVNHTSHLDGYTALDIHLFRRSVPGEIKKYEVDAWKAIRQLLFSHGLFPLENIADLNSGGIQISRNDRDFIADCEQQILAEITSQHDKAYHIRGNHPIEPSHLLFGFLKNFKTDDQLPDEHELSQVCYNIWIFMACYYNLSNPDDNYAESLKHIFAELDFSSIEMLTELNIPMDTFRNTLAESPSYSVEKHANVFCKADIYSNSFFAGSYTFNAPSNGASILLHREKSGQSILVQATKKVFNIHRKDNDQSWMFVPGSDVRFRSDYSLADVSVCFKFMKNKSTYQRELNWRTELGDLSGHQSIIPIIDSYDIDCAEETSRYVKDRQDQRFRKLPMRSKSVRSDTTEWLNLTQYPFAIVHPMSVDGNLLNVLSRGLIDTSSLKGIIADLGNVLKEIHGKGLIHGSFGARNILSFPHQSNGIWSREWRLNGLNTLLPISQSSVHLGAITPNGTCSFESSLLPPEMFKKLDSLEETFYNNYWRTVSELANVNIPKDVIKPRIDPESGDVYVVKCYCHLDEKAKRNLPPLPYELIKPSTSIDIWSFGVFLFTLISGGETLFQFNVRTGNMSMVELAAKWDDDLATAVIQQHITDPVAQDLLIHLLSPVERRRNLDMDIVLNHPFFISHGSLPKEIAKSIADARDERSDNLKLRMKRNENDERVTTFKNKTVSLTRLSIRNQLLLANSTTEIIRAAFDPNHSFPDSVPYSFIILPYKLAKNKVGKLTPTSMTDVELSERLGKHLLELNKATCFAACMNEFYLNASKENLELIQFWTTSIENYPIQTAEEILKSFHLDTNHFLEIASKFVGIVRGDKHTFLNNPSHSGIKLIKKYITPITQVFSVNNKAYLYPVDELYGMPMVESSKGRTYPHTFRHNVTDVLHKFLPYMQTSITRMMSESGSVTSLVKLIFEGASPKIPTSWLHAAKGIPKVFLKHRMVSEALMLREATQKLIQDDSPLALNGKKELDFIHTLFANIDSGHTFGGLGCVSDGRARMWTREEGIESLKQDCLKESDPEHLYVLYKEEIEQKEIMEEKDSEIAKLRKTVKSLSIQLGDVSATKGT